MPFLSFSPSSERMAMGVTSLPVPAVVGTMTVGSPGLGTMSTPKYLEMGPLLVAMMAEALAMSMGLPPPNPMTRSALCRLMTLRHSATIS